MNEAESKQLLRHYDVPVVQEAVATTEDEAVALAQSLGWPIVLKGLGARLTHKTERGLVKVNLHSADEVRQAYQTIKTAAGSDWEGCLIQPLIAGRREFVAGMVRDPQFGPVVMFGLGGIFEMFAQNSQCAFGHGKRSGIVFFNFNFNPPQGKLGRFF